MSWHCCRLYCGCGGKVSSLGREVAVMMDWSSSSCVMKGRFVGIEEGLSGTCGVVAVLGCLLCMVGFRIFGGARRIVWMSLIAESSSSIVRGIALLMLFFRCLVAAMMQSASIGEGRWSV